MAEFQIVAKEKRRMCSERPCADCPISMSETACSIWMFSHPEKTEQIVMQWATEHPIKTNGMKFEEVFGFTLHHKFCVSGDAVKWLDQ